MTEMRRVGRDNKPKRLPNSGMVAVLVSTLTLAVCGCSQGVSDKHWEQTVPGVYEGNLPNFREVLDLNTNGVFRHRVFVREKVVVDETGHWSYRVDTGIINLDPFTSFLDSEKRRITTNGVKRAVGALAVLRYGKAASKISVSHHTYYCLNKRQMLNPQ